MKLHLTYAAVLFLGMLGSRITLIGARGRVRVEQTNAVFAFVGMVATWLTISLLVWGFAALAWYWPVGVFIGSSFALALIVGRTTWGLWFSVTPLLDLLAVVGGLYLWIWHWPFG